MARILERSVNTDFLNFYNVEGLENCDPAELTIKVWDRYGTVPKDGDPASAKGAFIAAIVICDTCDKGVQLDRSILGG